MNYELQVLVKNQQGKLVPIPTYGHNGHSYVRGNPEQAYAIKFQNNTAYRVLAVISVDGKCIVDGNDAHQGSRGYIVPAYQSATITGWRTSLDKVAEFVFGKKTKSYAAKMSSGDTVNCGVIAAKVISEAAPDVTITTSGTWRVVHPWWTPAPVVPVDPYCWPYGPVVYGVSTTGTGLGSSAGSFTANSCGLLHAAVNNVIPGPTGPTGCNMSSAVNEAVAAASAPSAVKYSGSLCCASAPAKETPDFNLGTKFGSERVDSVSYGDFKRGAELATLEVYYSDAAGLKAAGIDISKSVQVPKPTMPQAFGGFCKPPK